MATSSRTPSTQHPRGADRRVIVVGSGVAGLVVAVELASASIPVLLVSQSAARRAPSVTDQDGFNAAFDAMDERDSEQLHFEESLLASASLADAAPLRAMVRAAPELVLALSHLGVPFARTSAGRMAASRAPGSRFRRTARVGTRTGQEIVFALEAELERLARATPGDGFGGKSAEPLVQRLLGWQVSKLVLDDDGRAVGVVARERRSGVVKPFRGEAVCLATGGLAGLYDGSTNATESVGSGVALAFRQGALLANAEFVRFRPLAVPGADKSHAVSELVRASGARVWTTNGRSEREALLQPVAGVHPGTEEAAAMVAAATARGDVVSLDLGDLDPGACEAHFGDWLRTLQHLGLGHPGRAPSTVRAAADLWLGGLWVRHEVDARGELVVDSPNHHATSIPGLYAAGECAHQYKGAGLASGNALLLCVFGGRMAAAGISCYLASLSRSASELPASLFEKAEARERERLSAPLSNSGAEAGTDAFGLACELGRALTEHGGVLRSEASSTALTEVVHAVEARLGKVTVSDRSAGFNHGLELATQLEDRVLLAKVLALTASARKESVGAHRRADEPTRAALARARSSYVRFDGEVRFVEETHLPAAPAGSRGDVS